MNIVDTLLRTLASRQARRRLTRVVPALGLALTAFAVVQRVRAKGVRRGGLDALLDLTPLVGPIKAVYEMFAGDIITAKRAH